MSAAPSGRQAFLPPRSFPSFLPSRRSRCSSSSASCGCSTGCSACSSSLGSIALGISLLRSGQLDLVVANYVQWSEQGDLYCTLDGTHKSYCTPESYKGTAPRLFHNLGNGVFEDVSDDSGIREKTLSPEAFKAQAGGETLDDVFLALTGHPARPAAEAVAIRGDRIIAVDIRAQFGGRLAHHRLRNEDGPRPGHAVDPGHRSHRDRPGHRAA